MLKKIEILSKTPIKEPKYIKSFLVEYKREGEDQILTWETIKTHNSVHIMVDNTETKELLFVKQIRIPVLLNNPHTDGKVIESCAGLVDKDKENIVIAQEEIKEEMGYDVPLKNIRPLRKLLSSVGTKGSSTELFTAQVDNSMIVTAGGGLNDEDIEIVSIPYEDAMDFVYAKGKYEQWQTDTTTIFLVMEWYLRNIKEGK